MTTTQYDVAVGRAILARDMALMRQFSTRHSAHLTLEGVKGNAGAALGVVTIQQGSAASHPPAMLPVLQSRPNCLDGWMAHGWLMDVLAAAKPPQ